MPASRPFSLISLRDMSSSFSHMSEEKKRIEKKNNNIEMMYETKTRQK